MQGPACLLQAGTESSLAKQTEQVHRLRTLHDPLERRYNGSHIYAPPGISLARWPAFPGNDPRVSVSPARTGVK